MKIPNFMYIFIRAYKIKAPKPMQKGQIWRISSHSFVILFLFFSFFCFSFILIIIYSMFHVFYMQLKYTLHFVDIFAFCYRIHEHVRCFEILTSTYIYLVFTHESSKQNKNKEEENHQNTFQTGDRVKWRILKKKMKEKKREKNQLDTFSAFIVSRTIQ